MAVERDIRIVPRRAHRDGQTDSLGGLFRQLADESGDLIRQELNLAKLEMKESTTTIARNMAGVAVWAGVAAVGGLALTAFLIIVIGLILGDAYWAGALIVGILFVALGGFMAKRSLDKARQEELKPEETIRTLKEDQRWLKREASDLKRGLTA